MDGHDTGQQGSSVRREIALYQESSDLLSANIHAASVLQQDTETLTNFWLHLDPNLFSLSLNKVESTLSVSYTGGYSWKRRGCTWEQDPLVKFSVSCSGFRRRGISRSFSSPSKANSEPTTRNPTCLMMGNSSQTSTRSHILQLYCFYLIMYFPFNLTVKCQLLVIDEIWVIDKLNVTINL